MKNKEVYIDTVRLFYTKTYFCKVNMFQFFLIYKYTFSDNLINYQKCVEIFHGESKKSDMYIRRERQLHKDIVKIYCILIKGLNK